MIDFGLALRQKVVQTTMNASTAKRNNTLLGGSIAGTMDYAAPEQMGKRNDPVGLYSDVYGWAKTCCYAQFRTTQPLLSHWQSIPLTLAQVLERCLSEDPAKRPQSFAEVLESLNTLSTPSLVETRQSAAAPTFEFENPETVRRKSSGVPRRKHQRSKFSLLIASGGALAVLALVLLFTVVLRSKTKAGMLVVEVDQPGAEVFIDGKRYTITQPGDKESIQIEVQEGSRNLKVVKGGFETFTREFTVKSGGKETVRVRLEPMKVAAKDAKPTLQLSKPNEEALPLDKKEREEKANQEREKTAKEVEKTREEMTKKQKNFEEKQRKDRQQPDDGNEKKIQEMERKSKEFEEKQKADREKPNPSGLPSTRTQQATGRKNNPRAKLGTRDYLRVKVSLKSPYPQSYRGAPTDKISVQYAVMELLKQVGVGYDFNKSQANVGELARRWIKPNIVNQPCATALNQVLGSVGLTYELVDNKVVLKRK